MPTSTIRYVCTDIDQRIEMRGEIDRLRSNPHVTSVGMIERENAYDGRLQVHRETTRWQVEHDDVPYTSRDSRARELSDILRAREDGRFEDPAPPPPTYTPPNLNGDRFREGIIEEYVRSQAGRSALAQAMIAPLRARRDYQSLARRTFLVDQLPDGAASTYSREPEETTAPTLESIQEAFRVIENQSLRPASIMMSQEEYDRLLSYSTVEQRGLLEQSVNTGRVFITAERPPLQVLETAGQAVVNPRGVSRLTVPHFEIASNPTINIGDIRQRRFDLIDRTPPFVWPEWAAVGAWICLKSDPTHIATVENHQTFTLTARIWRGIDRTESLSSLSFIEQWQPCAAPGPVPSRYDREEVV